MATSTRKTASPRTKGATKAPATERAQPETAPDTVAHPAPRPRDAPRTMRDLRLFRETHRRSPSRAMKNPLRDGLRLERVPDPAVVALFGATGDLAHRKV